VAPTPQPAPRRAHDPAGSGAAARPAYPAAPSGLPRKPRPCIHAPYLPPFYLSLPAAAAPGAPTLQLPTGLPCRRTLPLCPPCPATLSPPSVPSRGGPPPARATTPPPGPPTLQPDRPPPPCPAARGIDRSTASPSPRPRPRPPYPAARRPEAQREPGERPPQSSKGSTNKEAPSGARRQTTRRQGKIIVAKNYPQSTSTLDDHPELGR